MQWQRSEHQQPPSPRRRPSVPDSEAVRLAALQASWRRDRRVARRRIFWRWIVWFALRYLPWLLVALALLMWLWRPLGGVVWDVANPIGKWSLHALFALGWLGIPLVSLLINHFDLFGTRQVWLHLRAQGHADLECQRCLEPVRWPLDLERSFLFVADEEAAEALDAESEHDVLALPPRLDLFQLLEDELLLALPLIAMHDGCPTALPHQPPDVPAGAAGPAQEDPHPVHPFAALAALKRGEPGH